MSPWARSSFIYAYPTLLALTLFLDNMDYKLTALVSNLVLFFVCFLSEWEAELPFTTGVRMGV